MDNYEPVDRSPRWAIYTAAFIITLIIENAALGFVEMIAAPFVVEPGSTAGLQVVLILSVAHGMAMAAVWVGFYSFLNQLDLRKVLPWIIALAAFRILLPGLTVGDEVPLIWVELLISHLIWVLAFVIYFWIRGRLAPNSQDVPAEADRPGELLH